MELSEIELRRRIDKLENENIELLLFKKEHSSAKQSFLRMSARLRKLCKRLEPKKEIVTEMQAIADDIRHLTKSLE